MERTGCEISDTHRKADTLLPCVVEHALTYLPYSEQKIEPTTMMSSRLFAVVERTRATSGARRSFSYFSNGRMSKTNTVYHYGRRRRFRFRINDRLHHRHFASAPTPATDMDARQQQSSSLPEAHTIKTDRLMQAPYNPYEEAVAKLPRGSQLHLDFFGEPVTFLRVSHMDSIGNAIAALDGFEIGVISKGKAFTGGGEEEGIGVQAAHSAALSWAELLRHAAILNSNTAHSDADGDAQSEDDAQQAAGAPMLTYVALAPMLAQTGLAYLKYIDTLLKQVDSGVEGMPSIQMLDLARKAIAMKDSEFLNERERMHLRALECMLDQDHKRALYVLQRHLQNCPGDALALSIVIDLAHTVGDDKAAARYVST